MFDFVNLKTFQQSLISRNKTRMCMANLNNSNTSLDSNILKLIRPKTQSVSYSVSYLKTIYN